MEIHNNSFFHRYICSVEKKKTNTEKRFCCYCGSRLMVDVLSLRGSMALAVKCTKCKRQNIITETENE